MKIVAFSNYEKTRPKARSLDIGFKKEEGVVGHCWHFKNPIAINNVKQYIDLYKDEKGFMFKILDQNDPVKIGSIVCYPVINRLIYKEKIEAILCIDCDKEDMFNIENEIKAKYLRREVYPYLRFLCLFYSIINALE